MKSLEFAPELTFQKTLDGVNYFQLQFRWLHHVIEPPFPIPIGQPRAYIITVAEKGDEFTANIRDEIGLDFGTEVFGREDFAEKWRTFYAKLKG